MRSLAAVLLAAALCGCATPRKDVVRDPRSPEARELVDLASMRAGFRFDVRYATAQNFTHVRLYRSPRVLLRRDAAAALAAVQRELAAQGLSLKIYDAYRPLSVQQRMWDLIRDERYVSNPAKNAGRHTRGTAVDVTLVDARGVELSMPTAFDDFTTQAHRQALPETDLRRLHADFLEEIMDRHGFEPYPFEWWHFDFRGWEKHPPLDLPL